MYLLYVVTEISTDLAWMASLSAWDHFRTTELIDGGVFPMGDMVLFALVALAGWIGGLAAFHRRDLAA